MSELSYKELQEQGVFNVPYRAFKYMQSQQAKIDELQGRIDGALKELELITCYRTGNSDNAIKILKGEQE